MIGEESLEDVRSEWEELARRLEVAPFLTPWWIEAWWGAFGKGTLRVITARKGPRLLAAIPVVRRHGALLSPTNWHTPVYGPVAESEALATEIYEHLISMRARRLELRFLDGEPDGSGVRSFPDPKKLHVSQVLRSPHLPISGEWDDFWPTLSKNLRKTINRSRNRLEDLGTVELEVSHGEERLDDLLEEGFRLEDSGWKAQGGTSILAGHETRHFYRDLARRAAERGTLRLAFLRVDGRAVAFNYCLEQHGSHYLIKLGHDTDLSRFGPGTVLTADMVERAFREGLRSYEFLGDDDRYKLRWSEQCRYRYRVQVFAPGPIGSADRAVNVHGRRLAKWLLARSRRRTTD